MAVSTWKNVQANIDWRMLGATVPLFFAGLSTMRSFVGDNYFFERQLLWILVGALFFFVFAFIDWRILKSSGAL